MMNSDMPLNGSLSTGVAATTPGTVSMRASSSFATSKIRWFDENDRSAAR